MQEAAFSIFPYRLDGLTCIPTKLENTCVDPLRVHSTLYSVPVERAIPTKTRKRSVSFASILSHQHNIAAGKE
jgi:hypothetical protein